MSLGHATAADLLKKTDDGLAGLDLSEQIQLLMDGSNMNWKVILDMKKEREEAGRLEIVKNLMYSKSVILLLLCCRLISRLKVKLKDIHFGYSKEKELYIR